MTKTVSVVLASIGALLLAGTFWIGWRQGKATESHGRAFTAATATEIFNLRSRCAELGHQIMDNNFIGPALTQSFSLGLDAEISQREAECKAVWPGIEKECGK
jgi:hypothetical protein